MLPISERYKVQFRAESFNLTNTAIRNGPGTTFTDPTTGAKATLQQFLSPAAILAPRTVVFRAAMKF